MLTNRVFCNSNKNDIILDKAYIGWRTGNRGCFQLQNRLLRKAIKVTE